MTGSEGNASGTDGSAVLRDEAGTAATSLRGATDEVVVGVVVVFIVVVVFNVVVAATPVVDDVAVHSAVEDWPSKFSCFLVVVVGVESSKGTLIGLSPVIICAASTAGGSLAVVSRPGHDA